MEKRMKSRYGEKAEENYLRRKSDAATCSRVESTVDVEIYPVVATKEKCKLQSTKACASSITDRFKGEVNSITNDSPKDRLKLPKKKRKLRFISSGIGLEANISCKPSLKQRKFTVRGIMAITGVRILDYLDIEEAAICLDVMKLEEHDNLWSHLLQNIVSVRVKGNRHAFIRRFNEWNFVAEHGWLKKHRTLRKSFFPILCNWLVELHFELFGDHARKLMCRSPLNPIHLAMKYLFRFLSLEASITSSRLQLVGVSCYQISVEYALGTTETAKLDLDAKRYAYYTDNAYTPEEVTNMTANIKLTLQDQRKFTPSDILEVFTPTMALNSLIRSLSLESNILLVLFANYLVDLCMHDTFFSHMLPSEIAASAVFLACEMAEHDCSGTLRTTILSFCYRKSTHELQHMIATMRKLYDGACMQETGTTISNQILPKYSMVIKHYSTKFMEWIQGKLSPKYRQCLFKDEKTNFKRGEFREALSNAGQQQQQQQHASSQGNTTRTLSKAAISEKKIGCKKRKIDAI
eukprot:jgi/Bigna1/84800/estExt_fgenesh1_pg.C_10087